MPDPPPISFSNASFLRSEASALTEVFNANGVSRLWFERVPGLFLNKRCLFSDQAGAQPRARLREGFRFTGK